VMDGLTKIVSQTLPIPQILWVRNIVFTCLAVAMLRRQSKGGSIWTLARSQRPLLQTFRAVLLVIESGMFMFAFKLMPLADVHAVAAQPLRQVGIAVEHKRDVGAPRHRQQRVDAARHGLFVRSRQAQAQRRHVAGVEHAGQQRRERRRLESRRRHEVEPAGRRGHALPR